MRQNHKYGINPEQDRLFDNIANSIKSEYTKVGRTINDQEIKEATDRLITYVRICMDVTKDNPNEFA